MSLLPSDSDIDSKWIVMELRQLREFLAVAERLHIAQPPLSQQIQALERDLGVRLFDRTTRWVRLTAAGEAMLPYARETIAASERARLAAVGGGLGEVGRVSIGFTCASSHAALPRLARAVRAEHPGIELQVGWPELLRYCPCPCRGPRTRPRIRPLASTSRRCADTGRAVRTTNGRSARRPSACRCNQRRHRRACRRSVCHFPRPGFHCS